MQEALAAHKSAKVRARLAANKAVDSDILRQLLRDPEPDVRIALLRDWWMDRDMELELAQDKNVNVRFAVAANQHVGTAAQLLLANDPDESVRARLIERDSHFMFTLHSRAQEILAQDVEQDIRESLATYPKLKPSAQLLLAKDDEICVRIALARATRTGMEVACARMHNCSCCATRKAACIWRWLKTAGCLPQPRRCWPRTRWQA
ncbi:hypothetical protein NWF32_23070 [Pseudomonas qingdaonensis]|nr:hypothetical protein [Pseudomonas qingdaonensis]